MWAEDFAVLTDLAPGVLLKLGCGLEGPERQLHSPDFDLDERCLPIGAGILAEAAVRLLRQDPL
jgi:metal-dependent amidase/aminoacylase/carboxypeptidase family protein